MKVGEIKSIKKRKYTYFLQCVEAKDRKRGIDKCRGCFFLNRQDVQTCGDFVGRDRPLGSCEGVIFELVKKEI